MFFQFWLTRNNFRRLIYIFVYSSNVATLMQKDCSKQKFVLSIYCKAGCLKGIQTTWEIYLLYWEINVPTKKVAALPYDTVIIISTKHA